MALVRRWVRRARRRDAARGAAAVEFALVGVILVLIVFGILQYGLYFDDSLNANHGVRETARMSVVGKTTPGCGTPGWPAISCTVESMVDRAPADTYVKLSAPDGWARGNLLQVCVLVRSRGDFGMLPMPNGGFVRASLRMSIEEDTAKPAGTGTADAVPTGQSWAWCD
ncbi:TadE family protein [Nocardioides nitrophenolicus]|uniref:TadE family protein n=1 Tax=Nocardioides nitrophenolicus TaxID=60489 RepID=UPI00195CC41F|nr:TadE family protein [Nocardioides nitrophenolicus]MBM7519576.1 Flp pilus assembly pilin Flp [Nocardioides nitrophenolicus]